MSMTQLLIGTAVQAGRVLRATVSSVQSDDTVCVRLRAEEGGQLLCQLLQTSDSQILHLTPGDTVLLWAPRGEDERAIIFGRLGPSDGEPTASKEPPDETVIEAKHSLTLRVGEGSITIREDGKILIKGKDLVSHAQRVNRIKGGAVQIN